MIKNNNSLSAVKESIKRLQNKQVKVKVNMGRNKIVEFNGVVSNVYGALFTVEPENKTFGLKTTYSYSECLCGKVLLQENIS